MRQFLVDRSTFDVYLKKASDLFKDLLEKFVSSCNKAKKKQKLKAQDSILKIAEETFFNSKLAAEAFDMYSRQLKKQQVTIQNLTSNNKDYLKEYLQTLISAVEIISGVSTPDMDKIGCSLKQVMFHFMEIPAIEESMLSQHLDFCISHMSFTASFDFGYKLMDVIFKHSKRDEVFLKCQHGDCLRKITKVFATAALKTTDESRFRTEVINFFNLILNQVDDYQFKTFPEELHKLMNRIVGHKQDEDFLVNLVQKLANICEKRIKLKLHGSLSMMHAAVSSNPFNEVLSKFAAKVLTPRNSACDQISLELYRKLLTATANSLILNQDLSFFALLQDISEENYRENKEAIFGQLGNFTTDLCCHLASATQDDLAASIKLINITTQLVAGVQDSLMMFGPANVIEIIVDFIVQIGQKLKGDILNQFGSELLPVVVRGLEQFDKINDSIMNRFFQYLSTLVVSDQVFNAYKREFIKKLFTIRDQRDMHTVLGFYHTFFEPTEKSKFLKQFLSDMLLSLKNKDYQRMGWPITYELIQFTLESFMKREVEDLKGMMIHNTILRVFQLFNIFTMKREEVLETTEELNFSSPVLSKIEFSDRKLFSQIVEKIQAVFRNDAELISNFSDLRGYEKICQEAAYYIEDDDDTMDLIQFLTTVAYQIERPVVPQFQTIKKRVFDLEQNSKRIEHRTMLVVQPTDKVEHQIFSRNTLHESERLGFSQLKDLYSSKEGSQIHNLSLFTPDNVINQEEATVIVPQLIYSIVLYLLDRSPINFRENYLQTFLHRAENSVQNFEKLHEGKVFFALASIVLEKNGMDLQESTQERILKLLKRKPTPETYRLLYNCYFSRLSRPHNKNYEHLSSLVQFEESSQSQFAEYLELTNDKSMQSHYVVVPSCNTFFQPKYADKSMSLQLESAVYSIWLSRTYNPESTVKLTVFSLVLLFNETHKRKIELYWIGRQLRLRYTLSNAQFNKGQENDIELYRDLRDWLTSSRPVHLVFQLEFCSQPNRLKTTLYIDGFKADSREIPECGALNSKIGKDSKKKNYQAFFSYGYNEMELRGESKKDFIESTRVREVFLMSGVLTNHEVQLLYAIYNPQCKVTVNWFAEMHAVNLRNINSELKDIFTLMDKASNLKNEELKLPHRPLQFFVKLNTPQLFTRLEFLIQGVAKAEDPESTPLKASPDTQSPAKLTRAQSSESACSVQRLKLKMVLQSSSNVAALLTNSILCPESSKRVYLVYFNSEDRVNNSSLIKTAFCNQPNFDSIIRSECLLERYLVFFENSNDSEIVEVMRRDGMQTFQAASLVCSSSSHNLALLYILLRKIKNIPRSLVVNLVGLFGIKIKDAEYDLNRDSGGKTKESTHLLIDPHGVCLLFSVFLKNQWHKKLHLLLKSIRLTYLKESSICQ